MRTPDHRAGWAAASDGCRIAYRVEGNESHPALLLANSLGTDVQLWAPQMLAFGRHFRVIRYDMRGHGRSDLPAGDYRLERLAQDAIDLLDELGLQRVLFCGISLGGMVGQWLAAHRPERISAVALCNTSAYMGPQIWRDRIAAVQSGGIQSIAEGVLNRWLTTAYRTAHPEMAKAVQAMLLSTPPLGYISCCAAIRDMDLRPLRDRITRPALVIGGAQDLATPPAHAEQLANGIKDVQLVMLQAAHLSNWEQPEQFCQAVVSFFAGRGG